jgi:hypothetical protein
MVQPLPAASFQITIGFYPALVEAQRSLALGWPKRAYSAEPVVSPARSVTSTGVHRQCSRGDTLLPHANGQLKGDTNTPLPSASLQCGVRITRQCYIINCQEYNCENHGSVARFWDNLTEYSFGVAQNGHGGSSPDLTPSLFR